MPEIEIRPALSADIDLLTRLDHRSESAYVWQMERALEEDQFNVTFRQVRLPRTVRIDYPRMPQALQMEWKAKTAVLVALADKRPVGYLAVLEQQGPAAAWVTDLVVDTSFRRKGIATALMLAVQDWAGQRRLRRLVLELQSKNHPAVRLALKLGMEFCGYHDHYYHNQDIALFFARGLR